MPNYKRNLVEGGTYFFTVNLADRQSTLLTDEIETLRNAYGKVQSKLPFKTIAICILPDHLHCIWELPEGDSDYSTRWRLIKTAFTKSLSVRGLQRRKGEAGIWQRRYWEHTIETERDLNNCINYIHANPFHHGYVNNIDDWPYSSWQKIMREEQAELDVRKIKLNQKLYGE